MPPGSAPVRRAQVAEPGELQHLVGAAREPRARQPVGAAEEEQVLVDRQVEVERELLRHVADRALHRVGIARRRRGPATSPRPQVGAMSPVSMRMVVDFPAPFAPR